VAAEAEPAAAAPIAEGNAAAAAAPAPAASKDGKRQPTDAIVVGRASATQTILRALLEVSLPCRFSAAA